MVSEYNAILSAEGLLCAFSSRTLHRPFCCCVGGRGVGSPKGQMDVPPSSWTWSGHLGPGMPCPDNLEPTFSGHAGSSPCCSTPLGLKGGPAGSCGRWVMCRLACPHMRDREQSHGERKARAGGAGWGMLRSQESQIRTWPSRSLWRHLPRKINPFHLSLLPWFITGWVGLFCSFILHDKYWGFSPHRNYTLLPAVF